MRCDAPSLRADWERLAPRHNFIASITLMSEVAVCIQRRTISVVARAIIVSCTYAGTAEPPIDILRRRETSPNQRHSCTFRLPQNNVQNRGRHRYSMNLSVPHKLCLSQARRSVGERQTSDFVPVRRLRYRGVRCHELYLDSFRHLDCDHCGLIRLQLILISFDADDETIDGLKLENVYRPLFKVFRLQSSQ
jgi:hypothetical protein